VWKEEGVGKHWHKQLIGAGVAAPRGQAGLEAFFFSFLVNDGYE